MISSIFSFRYVRAAVSLHWRVHLWHVWIAITFVAITVAGSLILGADGDDARPQRNYSNLESTEVAILGDSQLASVRTKHLSLTTSNFAGGGTAYPIQYALLRHFGPQMPELRVVLVGFSNIMLRNPDLERRKGDYRGLLALGLPWHKIPVSWPSRWKFQISYGKHTNALFGGSRPSIDEFENLRFLGKVDAATKMADPAFANSPNVFERQKTSQAGDARFGLAAAEGARKTRGYMSLYDDDRIERKNRRAFFGILEFCSSRGIEVVLLRTPTTAAFHGARSPEWNQAMVDLLEEARRAYPGMQIPVWDAESTERYPLESFRDPNHMTPAALEVFADYLNRRLEEVPFRDDSEGLRPSDSGNLLYSSDPREDIWLGVKEKEGKIDRVLVPETLRAISDGAFRVTLLPGEYLSQSDYRRVSAGSKVTAGIWLWSDRTSPARGLRLQVIRDGGGTVAGNGISILDLDLSPKWFTVTHTFPGAYPATRIQISNTSDESVTFYMAAPSLTRP